MARLPFRINDYREQNFNDIIDVRSESEFAIDSIPRSINLPVLNDNERKEVGTIHKQESAFVAKKRGAALISKNMATHLTHFFSTKEQDYRPLIYCWRGGQRSEAMALILAQVGWDVTLLCGGYKKYRRSVVSELEILISKLNFQVVCGLTGTGKTKLLRWVKEQGHQVLDLEKLAMHRGSLLGLDPGVTQPSQKAFDSAVVFELSKFDPNKIVWLECEGFKIGNIELPKILWNKMKIAPCIELTAALTLRTEFLLSEYAHFIKSPAEFLLRLQSLIPICGKEKIRYWTTLVNEQRWFDVTSELLEQHYDPCYRRALAKNFLGTKQSFYIRAIDENEFQHAFAGLNALT